jgi:hypothetical protein
MKKVLTVTTLAWLLAGVLHAQATLTGKWQGETRNGLQVVLDLTATETTLSGTLTREGQPSTISDGKVSKNSFTFKATLGERMESFTGEFDGDQINIWLERQGREGTVVLKRINK